MATGENNPKLISADNFSVELSEQYHLSIEVSLSEFKFVILDTKDITYKHLEIHQFNSKKFDRISDELRTIISNNKIENVKKFFTKDEYHIVIGAGSSGPDTRWGEKNFISLLNQLNEKGKYFFYIQCGPEQNEISKNIINNINKPNCMDLSKMNI